MNGFGLLRLTVVLFLVTFPSFTYAVNELIARVPGGYTQKPAYIENITLVSEPHGAYVEQSLYLNYSDHNGFPGSQTVEIIHRFELPEGSVVNDLWLWFGNDVMKAIVMDTWRARKIYDSVVSMKRDPAFLTKIGNQYELHVYPVVSGSFRKIKMNFITPTKWFGSNALCELPLKFLKASATSSIPVTMLFRSKYDFWGTPKIKEKPEVSYWHFIDTAGFTYRKTLINDIKPLTSFNLSFATDFNTGAFFSNNVVPRDYNYFQFGIIPWKAFNISQNDTTPRKVIAGIDLSGSYYKNFSTLIPNLKSSIKASLKLNDYFNIIVAGANRIVPLNTELLPYSSANVDTLLDSFVRSSYGDSVKQTNKPVVIYSDYSSRQIWSWSDINNYATPKYFNSIINAQPYFSTSNIITGYEHGYENVITTSQAASLIQSLDSLFLRGGRFVTYFDSNRMGREKLATHYIPTLSIQYKTNATVHISRNMNGNIGRFFPESIMHGGGYFFKLTDTTMKAEMVDDQGYPCIVSKVLGNGGLLVITGIWPFNDDEPMKKMIGVPLLGLNQNPSSNMLRPLLNSYDDQYNLNNINRFITFTNCDSLTTLTGTENWLNTYFSNFSYMPVFNNINLLDGSSIAPPSITIEGKEYYGSGYLLKRLADRTRGMHFETHFTDWPTIFQRLVPSAHNYIDSINITPIFSGPDDSLKEFTEVNFDRSDPDRPLFFLGSTNGMNQVNVNVDVKFDGIPEVKHGNFNYLFSVDTTNPARIVSTMMGYEKLKNRLIYYSTDTAAIVKMGIKYNLLCDYTGMLALEPNDTIHFMINPLDETSLPVELISFTADTASDHVVLNWITSSEKNNSGFEVLKKVNDEQYSTIGFVKGAGTTVEKQYYSFTDNELNAKRITYRLKQIDYDGTVRYSEEISITPLLPEKYALSQNYPNPFNPSTTIKFDIPSEGKVTLKVYDILGKEVKIIIDDFKKPGRYSVSFDGSELSSGVYIYQLTAEGFVSSRKMLLIK